MQQLFWKHSGCQIVDQASKFLINHHLVSRDIFFAQRRLKEALEGPFYLFTGRGPSTQSMQFAHLLPFMLCRHIQSKYNCPLVIQISDDEKYYAGRAHDYQGNLKEIEAMGFVPELTHILINSQLPPSLHNASRMIQRHVTVKTVKRYFGFEDDVNIGSLLYPSVQIVPTISTCMCTLSKHITPQHRCLIVAGVDQSPYFSLARDVWRQISDGPSLATLYNKFLPALDGSEKASSSIGASCIFLNASDDTIRRKIRKAYSGSAPSLDSHTTGGVLDLERDVAFSYLRAFMENEEEYLDLKEKYQSGKLTSLQVKEKCAEVLITLRQYLFSTPTPLLT